MLELNLGIIGLFFSMLFSGTEIALISANKLQIDVWVKQKYKLAKLTKFIINNKSKFLTVSLIGTNLSNILASSFFTFYFLSNIESRFIFFPRELFFIPIAFIILCIHILRGFIAKKKILSKNKSRGEINYHVPLDSNLGVFYLSQTTKPDHNLK